MLVAVLRGRGGGRLCEVGEEGEEGPRGEGDERIEEGGERAGGGAGVRRGGREA